MIRCLSDAAGLPRQTGIAVLGAAPLPPAGASRWSCDSLLVGGRFAWAIPDNALRPWPPLGVERLAFRLHAFALALVLALPGCHRTHTAHATTHRATAARHRAPRARASGGRPAGRDAASASAAGSNGTDGTPAPPPPNDAGFI